MTLEMIKNQQQEIGFAKGIAIGREAGRSEGIAIGEQRGERRGILVLLHNLFNFLPASEKH